MKTRPIRFLVAALICCLSVSCTFLTTGCVGAPIEAASTKLKAGNALTGSVVEFELPKNLDAKKLNVTIDPATKKFQLSADELKTDASTVIESAGVAQAQALASMSGTLNNLTAILQQYVASATAPAGRPTPGGQQAESVQRAPAPAAPPPEPARTNAATSAE
jgi:hypothetical protein